MEEKERRVASQSAASSNLCLHVCKLGITVLRNRVGCNARNTFSSFNDALLYARKERHQSEEGGAAMLHEYTVHEYRSWRSGVRSFDSVYI